MIQLDLESSTSLIDQVEIEHLVLLEISDENL